MWFSSLYTSLTPLICGEINVEITKITKEMTDEARQGSVQRRRERVMGILVLVDVFLTIFCSKFLF